MTARRTRCRTCVQAWALVTLALIALAGPATAGTKTVNFDTLDPDTRVFEQYKTSHDLTFPGAEGTRPVVKSVGAKAHSGDRVGIYSPGGEGFSIPVLRGQLSRSADSLGLYAGYWAYTDPPPDPRTVSVRLRAFAAGDVLVAQSAYVSVTEGQPFDQYVSVVAPAGKHIDYFELTADKEGENNLGAPVGFDDLAITVDDSAPPPPPDFTVNEGETVANVFTGTTVEIPIDLNRINGSNGDISFSVSGLPKGMTANFDPNPVMGTGARTMLQLTAAENAQPSDEYSEILITATPTSPGAGPSPRTIRKLVRIRLNCETDVRFDYIHLRSDKCIRKNGPLYMTNEVHLNGLIIRPTGGPAEQTLAVDTQAKRIQGLKTDSPFEVSVPGSPEISLWDGPIDWKYGAGDDGPHKVDGFKLSDSRVINWLNVARLDASFLKSGKAVLTPTLRLTYWPFNYFGSLTASGSFTTDNDHGADFTGMELKVPSVKALGMELKDVRLAWQQGGTWVGEAKLILNFSKKLTIDAGFGLKQGDFDFLRGSVTGLNVAISPGVFLQHVGFAVSRNPFTLAGTVAITAGPKVAGVSALSVAGGFKAVLDDPFVVEIAGSAKLADRWQLGEAFVRYTSSTDVIEFAAKAKFDIWRLSLDGGVEGWVDDLDAFNVEGKVHACLEVFGINPCGDARLLVSTRGIAGCIGVYGYYVGAGATWDLDFDAFTGCDLAPYREVKPAARELRAAAEPHRTALPAGLPSAAWEVMGDGSVPGPGVTLVGPGGQAVSVNRDVPFVQNENFRAELRDDGTTFILANKPAAGTWTLSDDGSVPVTRIRESRGIPRPSAKARVSGRGRSRVLSWSVRRIPGQRVTFVEVGKGVRNAITTTTAARGSARFRPMDGPAGKREIVAIVEQNGNPRTTLTAGSYRAPGPLRPGRPRSLRVRRKGTRLVVSWRPNPSGFDHALYFTLGDGRRLLRVVSARRRSYTLKGVGRKTRAKVTVTGLTKGNAKGPAARATAR